MLQFHRIILAGVAFLGLAALAANAKPNFTGDWKLNVEKSEFGQFPGPNSMTQKATHDDPSLKVNAKLATDNGDFEFDATYSTDGKETTNTFGPKRDEERGQVGRGHSQHPDQRLIRGHGDDHPG